MKCPRCNAWADVFETCTKEDSTKQRRYQCAEGHKFRTVELVEPDSHKFSQPTNPESVYKAPSIAIN